MKRTLQTAFGALAVLTLVPATSHAGPWLPLDVGTRWEYVGDAGGHQVQTITGQTLVRGRTVAVKSYAEGPDAGLENYWLSDTDGSVLLAGFRSPTAAVALAYEPPLRILKEPPTVSGPQPTQAIVVHDLLTDAIVGEFEWQPTLFGTAFLQPPYAGITPLVTFGVGQVEPPTGPPLPPGVTLTVDGRHVPPGPHTVYGMDATDFYNREIGDVIYLGTDVFELSRFNNGPVPIAKSTWARVKRLYR